MYKQEIILRRSRVVLLLSYEHTKSDDALEQVFTYVGINGAERLVQQVDVPVLVDGTHQGHLLLLTPGQVDAL